MINGVNLSRSHSLPSVKETVYCLLALCFWFVVTVGFIGFRPEHLFLVFLIAACFFFNATTRKFLVAILPFIIFGISYDWMNLLPNYEVNPIDTQGIYSLEKTLFGISVGGEFLSPNEYFALHTNPVSDFLSGFFYLCWVPVPILFGFYLYFSKKTELYLHFALVFLFVNLMGFGIYYLHPAAPPWYVALYGFDAIPGTPGNVAGMGAFDQMTGLNIFDTLYARNANVFAALPSLHSAYPFIAFIYSLRKKVPLAWKIVLGVISVGIWYGAVYSSHHYIIDVAAGVLLSVVGILIFEKCFMTFGGFSRFLDNYCRYISFNKVPTVNK